MKLKVDPEVMKMNAEMNAAVAVLKCPWCGAKLLWWKAKRVPGSAYPFPLTEVVRVTLGCTGCGLGPVHGDAEVSPK